MISIHRQIDRLTDGSTAYNVVLRGDGEQFVIPMLSETAADRLQDNLAPLLNNFASDGAEVGADLQAVAGWPA